MNEVEIGLTKRAMRGYSFDDVAVVPSRRTRDPEDVSVSWSIDAFSFDMPVIAAPMDSVMSRECHRDRQARRPWRAQPRGPVDQV